MKSWQYFASILKSYYTFFITIVVNMSIFAAGMSVAWTSPVLVKLNSTKGNPLGHPITPEESDLIGFYFYLGGVIGPFIFAKSSKHLGRKRTIVISIIPSIIGYIILIFAKRIELYYIARLLKGLTAGGLSSSCPSYLAEMIFSVKKRGPYMAINSPAIQSGFLAAYAIGPYISTRNFNLLILVLHIAVGLLVVYGCPDSPHYIMENKGKTAAGNILKELDSENVENELLEIEKDVSTEEESSYLVIFKSKKNFKPFVMATMLLIFQQFSGIGIIFAYSQQIFLKSGEILPSEQCSIIVGIIQVFSSAAITLTSRKFSRKALLIFSLFGAGFFDIILGFYYTFENRLENFNWVPLVGLISFVIFYNSGLDPIPWVYLGEIYPMKIKTVGSTLSASIYWMTFVFISFVFYRVDVNILFLGFAVCCFTGLFYVIFELTETKGKTLREIHGIS